METIAALTEGEKNAAIVGGAMGAMMGMMCVFLFIYYIFTIIATWKIFKKAGEPGWKCLIPIYNVYIMYKIVGMTGWFWGLLLTSFVCLLVISLDGSSYLFTETNPNYAAYDASKHIPSVIAMLVMAVVVIWGEVLYSIRTSKAFGHGVGYALGLFFLQPIFWLILGFGRSKYHKKAIKK